MEDSQKDNQTEINDETVEVWPSHFLESDYRTAYNQEPADEEFDEVFEF